MSSAFSPEVTAKARRYAGEKGRVRPRSASPSGDGSWAVTGTAGEVYTTQVVLEGRTVEQITCTCPHGETKGGVARCSHALAVLLVIRRNEEADK